MKKVIEHKGYRVLVMAEDKGGIWAMIRGVDNPNGTPTVARVRELVNVTKHDPNERMTCVCQSCIEGRKMGMRAKERI